MHTRAALILPYNLLKWSTDNADCSSIPWGRIHSTLANMDVGTWVRIKESVTEPRHNWGKAKHGMVGRLHKKKSDETWLVDFPEIENTYWKAHPSELEAAPLPSLSEGDIVRVKKGVHRPRGGGTPSPGSVGSLPRTRNPRRAASHDPLECCPDADRCGR